MGVFVLSLASSSYVGIGSLDHLWIIKGRKEWWEGGRKGEKVKGGREKEEKRKKKIFHNFILEQISDLINLEILIQQQDIHSLSFPFANSIKI